jgi:5-methylcytosine-specific restriction endonuclease McrA
MLNSDVLVLNSGFVPLRVVKVRTAISHLVTNEAYPVIEEDTYIKSPTLIIRIPSVIALLKYGEFPNKRVAFSKQNVIYRDDMTCQFCGKQYHSIRELTVDHIIPRCKWIGKKEDVSTWMNLVCACKHCNSLKGNKTLQELGWKLIHKPFIPAYLPHLIISRKKAEEKGWIDFCKFNVRLIQ